jgi:hypothetical protein
MTDYDNRVIDAGVCDCVQYVFQKSAAAKTEERFRAAHPFGFSGGEYDCGDQCVSA